MSAQIKVHETVPAHTLRVAEDTLTHVGSDKLVLTYRLGAGYEIVLTVLPPLEEGETGYVDPVLFLNGHEACCIPDVSDELIGEYCFYIENNEVVLVLEAA